MDKSRGSKSVEVQRVWEIYDDRLQFMSRQDALLLDESLDAGDVAQAWLVWSGAAETALADAHRFSGGPAPSRGLVLGRGKASFRLVRLGGHKVRKVRGNAADMHDAAGIFLYRDSSIAPLLDKRRWFKAVLDVTDSMISHGVTLSRSVELTAQWSKILSNWLLYPVMMDDLHAVEGFGLGDLRRVVGDFHHRLSDFIHGIVVHRRDEAFRGWRNWLREDPLVHPSKWLRPDLVPLSSPISSVSASSCLLLFLLSLSLSLIADGLCGVCFLLRLVGLCTSLIFMAISVPMLILSSLLTLC